MFGRQFETAYHLSFGSSLIASYQNGIRMSFARLLWITFSIAKTVCQIQESERKEIIRPVHWRSDPPGKVQSCRFPPTGMDHPENSLNAQLAFSVSFYTCRMSI